MQRPSRARIALIVALAPLLIGLRCSFNVGGGSDPAGSAAGESAAGESASAEAEPTPGVESIGPDQARRLYFQYIDERGRVQFTERVEEVPEAWRDKVGFVELDGPPPMSPADARRTRDEKFARSGRSVFRGQRGAELAAAEPTRGPEIVLFYAEWCGYCRRAKAHLERDGWDYTLRDIDRSEALDELIRKTGQKAVPVIDIDGKVLIGYDANRLDQMLEAAS